METELLYYSDAYLKETTATVTEILDEGIILDRTIFFGRSCGVKPDYGTISSKSGVANVVDVRKFDERILHVFDQNPGFKLNEKVTLKIDWKRRYSMMKLHTALHILSSLIWKKFDALVTGSDITPQKAKIDFDLSRNFTKEELQWIEKEMNTIINENHQTSAEILPIEALETHPELIRTKSNILPKGLKTIRVVSIGNVDRQADGGLHVKSTREIESFKILKHKNKGRGIRRLEVAIE
ncbi:MAG: alanyl-tRNA editing protein [Methanobacteriota archaeon]|nr:MAG: alanyl-tRNA editing protein [Euryarchaeota archaeon]